MEDGSESSERRRYENLKRDETVRSIGGDEDGKKLMIYLFPSSKCSKIK